MEVTALPARRKVFFYSFIINDYAEAVLAAFYIGIPSQLVGGGCILPEYICKKKFYLVNSVGNIETIAFNVVAKGLEQRSVIGILNLCLTTFAFSANISPTVLSVGLIG